MFGRGVSYGDVSRCNECAENIPLLTAQLAQQAASGGTLQRVDFRYRCGGCDTLVEFNWRRDPGEAK